MASNRKISGRGFGSVIVSSAIFSLVFSLLLTGCQSINPLTTLGVGNATPEEGRIRELMQWHSGHVEVYKDFRTIFTARAVYLSGEIKRLAADWEIRSRLMSPEERKAFEKSFLGEGEQVVSVLVGFYTPQEGMNDLNQENSDWIPFIKNPDGTVIRATCLSVNEDNARPYMRFLKWDLSWSRLYMLCFPSSNLVPDAEGRITLVISGPQGQGEMSLRFWPPDGEL